MRKNEIDKLKKKLDEINQMAQAFAQAASASKKKDTDPIEVDEPEKPKTDDTKDGQPKK